MSLILSAFFSALLFGLGLGLSGMTSPEKVIGFLDVTGNWDPSLLFVMVGAIAVHGVLYRFIIRRKGPLLTDKFQIPTNKKIDRRLIIGSVMFGIGWGLGGFCPGPAIVATFSGVASVGVFLVSMGAGVYLHEMYKRMSPLDREENNGN